MKLELGQFYLGSHDTVFYFYKMTESSAKGMAWQSGLAHNVNVNIDKEGNAPYTFIPIEPVIAKMVQSGQAIDTGVV